jgi:alpha-N-arabinofuranosidase
LSSDRKFLTVAVVNPTESPQQIKVAFSHIALQDKARKWEVAVGDLQTRNVAGQEPKVKIVETSVDQMPGLLEVVPLSISLYEFKVR